MLDNYSFGFTPGPYINALDRLDAAVYLESYIGATETDIRAAISELVSDTLDLANQNPPDIAAIAAAALFNNLTQNTLTNIVYAEIGARNLVEDYINSNPGFDLTTANLGQLIDDATEASRIGIGLEFFRPQDLPPLVVDSPIPSFDFSFLQINPDLSFDAAFGTGFNFDFNFDFGTDFNFDFSSDFDFNFNFEIDFGDYLNFADYFGET